MTEPTSAVPAAPLAMLGEPDAAACDGDVCVLPDHREHAIVARRLDDDRI